MKNIQKFGAVLTLLAFTSIGCSSTSDKQVSSESLTVTENPITETQEVSSASSSVIASILENPVMGEEVTLQGQIVGQMEDCYIFTDGQNKIMIHFEAENVSYDPNTMVEISGTIEESVMDHAHNFKEEHGDIPMDAMIMVDQMEVIVSSK